MTSAAPTSVAFVTCDAVPHLTADDRLAMTALAARGHDVAARVWSDPEVDWTASDALILRSTWDYHRRPAEFRAWLDRLEREGAPLHNPPGIARWNMDKRYLRDLARTGVRTVPTVWLEPHARQSLGDVRRATGWSDLVVKPAISATAWRLRRVEPADAEWPVELAATLASDTWLVQPFVAGIADGEWSLVFVDAAFSHAVLKRPRAGDFRVQEEYGGRSAPATPPAALVEQASQVVAALPERPLYARVDGVDTPDGLLLLELELLEPVLFFGVAPLSVARFADAVEARLRRDLS